MWQRLAATCLIALALCACGSSARRGPVLAAAVAGQAISWAELQRYLNYSARFYASPPRCPLGSKDQRCAMLQRTALARLIQEHVIGLYAQRHGIRLSARERSAVAARAASMQLGPRSGHALLRSLGVSSTFLEAILERQELIQRVEDAVAPAAARRGPSLHLRKTAFSVADLGKQRAMKLALRLATDGGAVPVGAHQRDEWVATARVPTSLARLLTAASPGDFVGPLHQSDAYLVVQLLSRGVHPYGAPARAQFETTFFRHWLRDQVRAAHPRCWSMSGQAQRCPPPTS